MHNGFREFVALCAGRDRLGRAMRLKRFNRLGESPYLGYNFSYLRRFVLKKLMLMRAMSPEQRSRVNLKEMFGRDFDFGVVKRVYSQIEEPEQKEETESWQERETRDPSVSTGNSFSDVGTDPESSQQATVPTAEEYIPKSMKRGENLG